MKKIEIVLIGIIVLICLVSGTNAEGIGDLYNFTKATENISYSKVEGYENFSNNMSWDNFTAMIVAPYFTLLGNLFYLLILGIPLFMLWIRQENIILPVTIGFIIGLVGWNYLPPEYHAVSVLFLGLSIAGILFGIFKALR